MAGSKSGDEASPTRVGCALIVSTHRDSGWAAAVTERFEICWMAPSELSATGSRPTLIAASVIVLLDAAALDGNTVGSVARRIHAADPAVQIIAVTAEAERAEVKRSLVFAPETGDVWIVSPDELDAARAAAAVECTLQRRVAQTGATGASGATGGGDARAAQRSVSPRMRALESFLAGLLHGVAEPVYVVDESGHVLTANDAGEALFAQAGCSPWTDPVWSVLPPSPGSSPRRDLGEIESDYRAEIRRASPDSHGVDLRTFDVRIVPLDDAPVPAWLVAARESLLVGEQSARAEAQRLSDAAQRANAAKTEFLAMMSHELRTPINGIVGYTQLLEMGVAGELNASQLDYLARLRRSTGHLLMLVNDVLDLAKIDAHEMTTRSVEQTTASVVHDAALLSDPLAAAKGLRLTLPTPSDPDYAFAADPDRVRQVLINLLSNAVKFTNAGGEITVSRGISPDTPPGSPLLGGGPWTYLRVRDTGIGIPLDKQSAVFEPFVQVDSGRTRTSGGTGLGLAISRRLARLMGGELTLESETGVGSTFTLWLPAIAPAVNGLIETPEQRSARARGSNAGEDGAGLERLGQQLQRETSDIVDAWASRLRADPAFANMRMLDSPNLVDHTAAMVADLTQALIIVERTGGLDSHLLDDSSEIQHTIAVQHGLQRRRLRFTESQIIAEYRLLSEIFVERVRAETTSAAEARLAEGVIGRLMSNARAHSLAAFRASPPT